MWQCVLCGEEMNVFHRDEHVASTQHLRNILPATILGDTFQCGICTAAVAVVDIAHHVTSSPTWGCTACEDDVHEAWKEQHLATCRGHGVLGAGGVALEDQAAVVPDSAAPAELPDVKRGDDVRPQPPSPSVPETGDDSSSEEDTCPNCLRMGLAGHRCEFIKCGVCGVRMNKRFEMAHSVTLRHRNALKEALERAQEEEEEETDREQEESQATGGENPEDTAADGPSERATNDSKPVPEAPEVPYRLPTKLRQCLYCAGDLTEEHRCDVLNSKAVHSGDRSGSAVYSTPSQPTNAAANSTFVRTEWTCTVCSRKMPAVSRVEHLAGAKHRGREQILQKLDGGEFHSTKNASKHGKFTWDCAVCSRTMSALAKVTHLAGKKHQQMVLLWEEQGEKQMENPQAQPDGGIVSDNSIDPTATGETSAKIEELGIGASGHGLPRHGGSKNENGGIEKEDIEFCVCGELVSRGGWCGNCDYTANEKWVEEILRKKLEGL